MADTEIFIDVIATNCFDDINYYPEEIRAEIINRHPDIDKDVPLKNLSASQISE